MLPEVETELEIAIDPWLKRAAAKALRVWNPTTGRAVLAVGDQAVVSGTRFLTTALIGRVCGPTELGNYALAFTLYSLTACLQESLVTLPFTVFGNRLEGDERRRFAGSSLSHYAMLSTTLATILVLVALGWGLSGGASGLTPVLGMLGATLPAACLIEFARRYCLARLDLRAVLSVDVTMSVCQISGLALLASLGWLSTVTAYAAIAVAALITGSIWLTRMRGDFIVDRSRVMSDAAHNWKFSHWIVVSQVVFISRGRWCLGCSPPSWVAPRLEPTLPAKRSFSWRTRCFLPRIVCCRR